jgi:hypothetical protein
MNHLGMGELTGIGQVRAGPAVVLNGLVGIEVRVRVTAPAKF